MGGKINSTRTGDNDERKKVNYWPARSSLYHDSITAVIVRDSGWYHHQIITRSPSFPRAVTGLPPPAGTSQSMLTGCDPGDSNAGLCLTCREMTVGATGGGGPRACQQEGGGGVADHGVEIKVGVGRGGERSLPVGSHACSQTRGPESGS